MRTPVKSFLTAALLSLATIASIHAQTPSGIHVEAGTRKIVVFLNGNQMSLPTNSCFIANLDDGMYMLQVYDASGMTTGQPGVSMRPLHKQLIDYRQGRLVEVNVNMPGILPPDYGDIGDMNCYPPYDRRGVMSPRMFDEFLSTLKNTRWDSERDDIIETAVLTSRFTCQQCLEIMELYRFDNERLEFVQEIFPAIADKQNIFLLFNGFDYEYSKDQLREFLKKQYTTEAR